MNELDGSALTVFFELSVDAAEFVLRWPSVFGMGKLPNLFCRSSQPPARYVDPLAGTQVRRGPVAAGGTSSSLIRPDRVLPGARLTSPVSRAGAVMFTMFGIWLTGSAQK